MPVRPNNLYTLDALVPSAARTANGDSGIWEGYGPTSTLRVQLNVTAISGTSPNLTVFVEDSLDGTNWNQLFAFAARTAVGREVLDFTGPYSDMIRVRWVITGTTPSATFGVVAFAQAPGV